MASSAFPKRQRAIGTSRSQVDQPIRQLIAVVILVAVEVILVLGLVAMSVGLGVEGYPGVGPDRPPRPVPAGAHGPGSAVGRA